MDSTHVLFGNTATPIPDWLMDTSQRRKDCSLIAKMHIRANKLLFRSEINLLCGPSSNVRSEKGTNISFDKNEERVLHETAQILSVALTAPSVSIIGRTVDILATLVKTQCYTNEGSVRVTEVMTSTETIIEAAQSIIRLLSAVHNDSIDPDLEKNLIIFQECMNPHSLGIHEGPTLMGAAPIHRLSSRLTPPVPLGESPKIPRILRKPTLRSPPQVTPPPPPATPPLPKITPSPPPATPTLPQVTLPLPQVTSPPHQVTPPPPKVLPFLFQLLPLLPQLSPSADAVPSFPSSHSSQCFPKEKSGSSFPQQQNFNPQRETLPPLLHCNKSPATFPARLPETPQATQHSGHKLPYFLQRDLALPAPTTPRHSFPLSHNYRPRAPTHGFFHPDLGF
ncbi:hypothetical protein FHG87_019343 [Trinorchestia longiramus]|nr:hypothetical protein FHG87_019343 [Trinorchestia longiramus]